VAVGGPVKLSIVLVELRLLIVIVVVVLPGIFRARIIGFVVRRKDRLLVGSAATEAIWKRRRGGR